jgi:hypothetical protein
MGSTGDTLSQDTWDNGYILFPGRLGRYNLVISF